MHLGVDVLGSLQALAENELVTFDLCFHIWLRLGLVWFWIFLICLSLGFWVFVVWFFFHKQNCYRKQKNAETEKYLRKA